MELTPIILPQELAAEYVGLGLTTMEREVRKGRFPKPRKLSTGRIGWLRTDLDLWANALPISDLSPGPPTDLTVR